MKARGLIGLMFAVAMMGGCAVLAPAAEMLVEAEAFSDHGGWLVDPQFMDQIGSPYLLAHGLGKPVANAKTAADFREAGTYHVWVRAKDWVPSHHPGRFRMIVNGQELAETFGANSREWSWQNGGQIEVKDKKAVIELKDLTGFDGRCDAIYFTTDKDTAPPDKADDKMAAWRRRLLRLPETPPTAGDFDVVVAGGSIAGCSAALTAARLGLKVALVQERPMLGGNGSSEIGITLRDGVRRSIVNEVARADRERVLQSQPNISLYLNWHVFRAQMNGSRIASVHAKHTSSGQELRFHAPVFIDCTGVGALGFLSGADYRIGRESAMEFNESLAPKEADKMHHGNSPVFRTRMADRPVTFPDVPWATAVAGDFANLGGQITSPGHDNVGGLTHYWEYGQWLDPFADAERIRDHLLCAVFGAIANAKRKEPMKNANLELEWGGYVPAGGESRRLMGDYILTENDIRAQTMFSDAVATNSGHFCLHFPGTKYDFRLGDWKWIPVQPYSVPFRCLYSRNVENLMMAGKHISASHIAGSSVKTMLNGGQHGVAVGAAAFLCKKHDATPRGVCQQHIAELQDIVFERGPYKDALNPKSTLKKQRKP